MAEEHVDPEVDSRRIRIGERAGQCPGPGQFRLPGRLRLQEAVQPQKADDAAPIVVVAEGGDGLNVSLAEGRRDTEVSAQRRFGSGQTCWRRLDRWQQAGVFEQLHRILLAKLNAAGELDWSRACVDGSHIRAKKGVPRPVRRRSTGGKQAASTI
ncbi:hypothetical protein OHB35_53055 [Streptomyces phaeochromogenes]|uniref:Transposase n=1 Tax=Streptomyces phaeochromogenes TaxID=1923 RepID=A0ABZ1HU16_STRPH|nr:hypothetical protein [Streptomyces phaeochromogenes]WSD22065.1 hypothetical protein OHB35_53055 [Streptomyces phaeochromogenes]